jgi:hypothetical protein
MADSISSTLSATGELLKAFTWGKFIVLLVLLITTGLGSIILEIYSAASELDRLSKATAIIKQLKAPEFASLKNDPKLSASERKVADDLLAALERREEASAAISQYAKQVSQLWVAVYLAVAAPWWLTALLGVPILIEGKQGSLRAFSVIVGIGALLGLVAVAVPFRTSVWLYAGISASTLLLLMILAALATRRVMPP